MRVVIETSNKELLNKLIWFLKNFEDKGVKIIMEPVEAKKLLSDEYVKENWREIGMSTHSSDRDDDEYLYEAAWRHYNEKYSD
jgi:hypothetical protein